jgi:hypothetical protein
LGGRFLYKSGTIIESLSHPSSSSLHPTRCYPTLTSHLISPYSYLPTSFSYLSSLITSSCQPELIRDNIIPPPLLTLIIYSSEYLTDHLPILSSINSQLNSIRLLSPQSYTQLPKTLPSSLGDLLSAILVQISISSEIDVGLNR